MEGFEAAEIVYNRILETESESIARKIIGYIHLQDHAHREMIRFAFGPDYLIQTLIKKAKMDLNLSPKAAPSPFGPILHSHRPFSAPQMLHCPNMVHDSFNGLNEPFEPLTPNMTSSENCFSTEGNFRTQKICYYFSKGHCKNGNSCKFIHSQSMSDFNHEFEDQAAFSHGSLEKLEFEITEILKSRKGNPISIALLPMIYFERYGRTLQAEGYLTESQRHGKAGYSLTGLLARLRNSIRLIDRPHGQYAIVLADDVSRYLENRYERNIMNAGPKQIFLTFPSESICTEDDVANYFSLYGPVQHVRIPCQQKQTFGFVTFHDSETVQMILSKRKVHIVCGARVLVKPCREKLDSPMCYHSHHMDMDQDRKARLESSRAFDTKLVEERELAIELEMMHHSQLQLTRATSYIENTFDDQKPSEDEVDESNYQSPKLVTRLLDQDNEINEGLDLNLPSSPFACNKCS